MKNSTYLIILLAIGLVITSYKWITSASESSDGLDVQTSSEIAIENIMTRTSVRSYSGQEISKQQTDTLLRAAMAAPTAGNKQPWRFVVIDDKATLKYISENFSSMTMAEKASIAIVTCGDVSATFPGEGVDYWMQDVSAATENLLLAAHAMGLGAVWCGIYPIAERVETFSKLLDLPKGIVPLGCVCIGYPEGNPTPKDKWHPEYIHYDKW